MSWIKENKFLAGFTAATVVGAGALGFLTLQAKGRYDEATAAFEQESSELSRLQNAVPFPSPENVKKSEEQKKQHQQIINELQQSLAKAELPVEEISPQQFQDRLRQTVDSTAKNAASKNVKLPDKFAYGLERYLAEPPRPEAAPELGRQLKAMELAIGKFIEHHVIEIKEFKREELAEERGGSSSEAETPGKGGKGGKAEKELVKLLPFEVDFISDQGSLLMVLNSIVSAKEQFFIPRVVTVKNEKEQGPPRGNPLAALNPAAQLPPPSADPNAPAPAIPGAPGVGAPSSAIPGAPAGAPAQPALTYIVGEEKIEVSMRIEIADFANAPTTAAK